MRAANGIRKGSRDWTVGALVQGFESLFTFLPYNSLCIRTRSAIRVNNKTSNNLTTAGRMFATQKFFIFILSFAIISEVTGSSELLKKLANAKLQLVKPAYRILALKGLGLELVTGRLRMNCRLSRDDRSDSISNTNHKQVPGIECTVLAK